MNEREGSNPGVSLEDRVKAYYRHEEEYDWTRTADTFVGLESLFHRARAARVLKLVARAARPGRYLDVGCGTAMITRRLPGRPVGLDLNPRNLKKAMRYAQHGRFIQCDIEGKVPLQSAAFDVAVCTEVLEHLLAPEIAVREIHRVLRPGGIFIGSVPGRSPIWHLRFLSSSRTSFTEEPYHKHYRRREVVDLLTSCFRLRRVASQFGAMNWFFVAEKAKSS